MTMALAPGRLRYAKGGAARQFLNSSIAKRLDELMHNSDPALEPWVNSTMRRYLVRDFGTPEDPLSRTRARELGLPSAGQGSPLDFEYWAPLRTLDDLNYLETRRIVGHQPDYLLQQPDDASRLGALTNIYMRKWSPLEAVGTSQRRVQGVDSQMKSRAPTFEKLSARYSGLPIPTGFQDLVAEYGRAMSPLPTSRSLPEGAARRAYDVVAPYAQSPLGQAELAQLRNIVPPGSYSYGRLFRGQTHALRDMYKHMADEPDAPYSGPRLSVGRTGWYTPFIDNARKNAAKTVLERDPYLAKLDEPVRELLILPHYMREITDALSADLGAGRLRPESLSRLSVPDAARRAGEYYANLAKYKEADRLVKLKKMLASPDGLEIAREYPGGWRWDKLLTAKRAADEACVAGSTWCTQSENVARNYLNKNDLYLLRDPSGGGRVQVQYDPLVGEIKQIRNRKQSGRVSDEVMPYARDIVNLLSPRSVSDYEARQAFGLDAGDWRTLLTNQIPYLKKE